MSRTVHAQRLGAIPAAAIAGKRYPQAPALPRNAVLHGDCIEVLAELPAASVDFVLTDPPYLCNYRDRSGRTVANDNDPAWLVPAFVQIARAMKPNSLMVSFYGWQATGQFMDAWKTAGLRTVGHLVFAKSYASSSRYLEARHESAYLLAKGRPALPAVISSDVRPWDYTGNRLHPTQKPVAPLRELIELFCPAAGLVLDPFAGSGSALVAAKAAGRGYLGIELDAGHVATMRRRLA
jgi:adenine-specific DNA-methyltransferase